MNEISGIRKLFWELNILEQVRPENPDYRKYAAEAERLYQCIAGLLPNKQQTLQDYRDALAGQSAYCDEEIFILGFCYGAQTAADVCQRPLSKETLQQIRTWLSSQ